MSRPVQVPQHTSSQAESLCVHFCQTTLVLTGPQTTASVRYALSRETGVLGELVTLCSHEREYLPWHNLPLPSNCKFVHATQLTGKTHVVYIHSPTEHAMSVLFVFFETSLFGACVRACTEYLDLTQEAQRSDATKNEAILLKSFLHRGVIDACATEACAALLSELVAASHSNLVDFDQTTFVAGNRVWSCRINAQCDLGCTVHLSSRPEWGTHNAMLSPTSLRSQKKLNLVLSIQAVEPSRWICCPLQRLMPAPLTVNCASTDAPEVSGPTTMHAYSVVLTFQCNTRVAAFGMAKDPLQAVQLAAALYGTFVVNGLRLDDACVTRLDLTPNRYACAMFCGSKALVSRDIKRVEDHGLYQDLESAMAAASPQWATSKATQSRMLWDFACNVILRVDKTTPQRCPAAGGSSYIPVKPQSPASVARTSNPERSALSVPVRSALSVPVPVILEFTVAKNAKTSIKYYSD